MSIPESKKGVPVVTVTRFVSLKIKLGAQKELRRDRCHGYVMMQLGPALATDVLHHWLQASKSVAGSKGQGKGSISGNL